MKKISDKVASERSEHTPTPMGWVESVMHEKTRTLEEVARFAGPNAGRVIRAVNAHEELVEACKCAGDALLANDGDPIKREAIRQLRQAIVNAERK